MTSPTLGSRIREHRERKALTQAQVAQVIGVPRELVSMWETNARLPHRRHLQRLAGLYSVETASLADGDGIRTERERLLDQLPADARARRETERWLHFLDAWAEWLSEMGVGLRGPQKAPRGLNAGQVVTDARRAPTLAGRVREHYHLGLDALPDLRAFLDEQGVLVYRAPLGSIGAGSDGVSGAFYNHPELGYAILVNADTTPGRQAFTLAHEYAHALFHYPLGGLISRKGERDSKEVFADSFAAHFLVSGKVLRRLTMDERVRGELDPYQALRLAAYFRVSYATILVRLREEGLMDAPTYRAWKGYSPGAMAEAVGLDPANFRFPERPLRAHERYPLSVLEGIKHAIRRGNLPIERAAAMMDMEPRSLRLLAAEPPQAQQEEEREFEELPF